MSDERGAIAVTVALLMVALIGFAALAIDIGALYQERQTLQNGADAAALAVAKDCAAGDCGTFNLTARDYADANADDGRSNAAVCGNGPRLSPGCAPSRPLPTGALGHVQVTTSTWEVSSPDNPTEVNFNFAPVFDLVAPGDHDGKTMRARAVAAWGPAGSATTLPVALSRCEFDLLAGDLEPPFTESIVYLRRLSPSDSDCGNLGPSGFAIPGGFGWLDDGPDCELVIEVGDWVGGHPGARPPDCVRSDITVIRNKTVLVPIFDEYMGFGGGGAYHIIGFAAFHVVGYRLPAQVFNFSEPCPPLGVGCLKGHFTGFTTTGTVFGDEDFGVNIIKLVG